MIGWAMVGRGELGFVMAEESFKTGLTGELAFSITVRMYMMYKYECL